MNGTLGGASPDRVADGVARMQTGDGLAGFGFLTTGVGAGVGGVDATGVGAGVGWSIVHLNGPKSACPPPSAVQAMLALKPSPRPNSAGMAFLSLPEGLLELMLSTIVDTSLRPLALTVTVSVEGELGNFWVLIWSWMPCSGWLGAGQIRSTPVEGGITCASAGLTFKPSMPAASMSAAKNATREGITLLLVEVMRPSCIEL